MVEPFDQLHSAIEKLLIRNSLSSPTLEHLVDPITFLAAEFAVRKVRIVNDFGNNLYLPVANPEFLLQCLEGAVLAMVSKAALVKHIERYGLLWYLCLRREGKSCFGIYEASN